MADPSPPASSYLSIGEVLSLVHEEFPDVTISKIRFLESQGLIDPERTPSGYRKFYEDDVELLRCILREQRENYLPLRVIKDRLDSGEIDPTNEHPRPAGIRNVTIDPTPTGSPARTDSTAGEIDSESSAEGAGVVAQSSAQARRDHPAGRSGAPTSSSAASFFAPAGAERPEATPQPGSEPSVADAADAAATAGRTDTPLPVPPGGLDAAEMCALTALTAAQLDGLVSFGVVVSTDGGGTRFDDRALEIATIAKRMIDAGLDPRHLRGWRVAVDREAGLFEQLIQPLLRQRNPEAQQQALAKLRQLERLGSEFHAALMRDALHSHLDR